MAWSAIHPVTPRSSSSGVACPVYVLQASQELPKIDCTLAVSGVVFSPPNAARFKRWSWRTRKLTRASVVVALTATWFFPFVELGVSRVLAVAGFVCMVLPFSITFLTMRYDMAKLLISTYEFWYILINSAIGTALQCVYFQDSTRGVLAMMTLLGYVSTFMIDANRSSVKMTVATSACSTFSVASMTVAVALEMLPEVQDFALFTYKQRTLNASDLMLNSFGIVLTMLTRNAYRHKAALAKASECSSRVRVLAYRVRVKYVEWTGAGTAGTGAGDTPVVAITASEAIPSSATETQPVNDDVDVTSAAVATRQLTSLEYVAPLTLFHSLRVIWPSANRLLVAKGPRASVLTTFAFITMVLHAVGVILPWQNTSTKIVSCLAMGGSIVYCFMCIALQNRQMWRLLVSSFDVIFLLFQHTCTHVTTAYLFQWGDQCIFVVASWCWIYWLVTIDALTPTTKSRLGISKPLIVGVIVMQLLSQVGFCSELVFQQFSQIPDREIVAFTATERHRLVLMAIPFLFTRVVSVFWWTWRLLYRVCTQHPDELIVVQGATEYQDDEQQQRRRSRQKTASQVPASQVL